MTRDLKTKDRNPHISNLLARISVSIQLFRKFAVKLSDIKQIYIIKIFRHDWSVVSFFGFRWNELKKGPGVDWKRGRGLIGKRAGDWSYGVAKQCGEG